LFFFPSLSAGKYSFELFEFFWVKTCEDPDLQPALSVLKQRLQQNVPSRIHGQWLTNTTRGCACQTYKNLSLNWHWWFIIITYYYPRNWEKFTATDCWLMAQLQPEKNRIRHPAEATLATTSETLDRGDGLSV
jgi:hypothetical protein